MLRAIRLAAGVSFLLACSLGLLILHACQREDEITQPSAVAFAVRYRLTVSGLGTGTGTVTSSPVGINCTITAGTPASTGCTALFNQGTTVALSAQPVPRHSFAAWGKSCKGTTACSVRMTVARAVSAQFLRGPFTIRISGGAPGSGSGTVRSQAGLTPAINCVITSGTPAATGCSARYPAYTSLVLTAVPASDQGFSGWGTPCSGNGSCPITVIKSRNISATFTPLLLAELGQWSSPFPWPIVGVHLHLLPTGEVLSFGKTGTPRVWKPSTGAFIGVPSTTLMFCGGHAFLPDGRLLLTGGNIRANHGLPDANIFDPATRTLTRVFSMAQGRWYPTSTTLADGEVVTLGGADENGGMVAVPEVWNGTAWRQLSGASLTLPYYPWMFQAPDGKVFYAGPSTGSQYLDPAGEGSWSPGPGSSYGYRESGAAVMYEPGKVLIVGGGGGTATTLPTGTAETIDLTIPSPSWQNTGSMAFARRHLNATLLPTGDVLVIGGTSGPGWNDVAGTVHEAEIWSPATRAWTTLAPNTINRIYHSAAILLPDGRVLVTGAGARAPDVDQLNAELYSPPYLFRGTRPTLTGVPADVSYGASFSVLTPSGASVERVTLVRLGSVTHAFDQNQRFVSLSFEPTSGGLSVTAPANGNVAPPGHYMLFLVNGDGVPSVARIVRLH